MILLPHLETDVTLSCQLSCVACNHHVPLYRATGRIPPAASPEQVFVDLYLLSTILHVDAWAAIGGEPLLHKNLVAVLEAARSSGVADKIEVWTNGILLKQQGEAFWRSLDVLVLSRYEGKLTDEYVAWIEARCAEAGVGFVLKDERSWHNFRTLLEPRPTSAAVTVAKYQGCFFRSYSRVANAGYFFTCCAAPHMSALIQGRPFGSDGVRIEGLTEAGLFAYLNQAEPLGACVVCAGRDTAVPIQWREERDPKRWLAASAGREL